MTESLLPCPFCGGEARLDQRKTQSLWNSNDAIFSHVTCDECDVQGQDFCDDPDGQESIKWWNRRAALAAPVQGCAEPFAVTTGYFGGHATIRPINPAVVINSGLALYTTPPQPAEVGELVEALREIEWSNDSRWQTDRARAALAKLEGANEQ